MGLDSYLYAKQNFYSGDYLKTEQKSDELYEMMNATHFMSEGRLNSATVQVEIAYWRKCNYLHNFFVTECGDGTDECQDIYVTREQLEELINRCDSVLDDNSKASELLPTQSGFFFGSTDYDDYYFESVKYTRDKIQEILNHSQEEWDFIYQASW